MTLGLSLRRRERGWPMPPAAPSTATLKPRCCWVAMVARCRKQDAKGTTRVRPSASAPSAARPPSRTEPLGTCRPRYTCRGAAPVRAPRRRDASCKLRSTWTSTPPPPPKHAASVRVTPAHRAPVLPAAGALTARLETSGLAERSMAAECERTAAEGWKSSSKSSVGGGRVGPTIGTTVNHANYFSCKIICPLSIRLTPKLTSKDGGERPAACRRPTAPREPLALPQGRRHA